MAGCRRVTLDCLPTGNTCRDREGIRYAYVAPLPNTSPPLDAYARKDETELLLSSGPVLNELIPGHNNGQSAPDVCIPEIHERLSSLALRVGKDLRSSACHLLSSSPGPLWGSHPRKRRWGGGGPREGSRPQFSFPEQTFDLLCFPEGSRPCCLFSVRGFRPVLFFGRLSTCFPFSGSDI